MRKKMIKNFLGLALISLTVFSGCGEASTGEGTTQQQSTNNKKEKNKRNFLGDVQITINDYKLGTHSEITNPILIVEYKVNNTGTESINFSKRYSTNAIFETFRLGEYYKTYQDTHREEIHLSELDSKYISPIEEEVLPGETKLIKKYYMMPGVGAFYGGGLNFDITILDVKSGQSMEIGFYI